MISFFAFIIVIGVLVTFHELGHYWVAKLCGVKVLRFSVGFGRPILRRQWGETEWVICPIPLGGYVRMLDEREGTVDPHEQHRSFNQQSVVKRIAIVAAGPVANLVLAVILYWIILVPGVALLKPEVGTVLPHTPAALAGFQPGDRLVRIDGKSINNWQDARIILLESVSSLDKPVTVEVIPAQKNSVTSRTINVPNLAMHFRQDLSMGNVGLLAERYLPIIGSLNKQGSAAQAGMRIGDRIISVDNKLITQWSDWVEIVRNSPGKDLTVRFERAGQTKELVLRPASVETEYGFIGRIGAAAQLDTQWLDTLRFTDQYSPVDTITLALKKTADTAGLSLRFLGRMVIGQASFDNLSGPLTIATMAGRTVREGWKTFLEFMALISISIGVLNLLPIPVLDGGQLLYYIVELVKGRPLSEAVQYMGQKIGFMLLVLLMAVALLNDISRLWGGG